MHGHQPGVVTVDFPADDPGRMSLQPDVRGQVV